LRANPIACSDLALQRAVRAEKDQSAEAASVSEFFDRCGTILSRFAPTKLGALLRLEDQEFSIDDRATLHEVVFTLPFQIVIHGLLALKPSAKPRPMLIVICGTACNLGDNSARVVLGPLFDENPFNVLVLPSVT